MHGKKNCSSLMSNSEEHTCKTIAANIKFITDNKKLDYNPLTEQVNQLYLISYNIQRGRCITKDLILPKAIVSLFVHITSSNTSLRA